MELQAVGLREAAKLLRDSGYAISHSTISRGIRDGAIPNRGSDARPRVIVSEVISARSENVDQSKQRGATASLLNDDVPSEAEEAAPEEQAVKTPAARRPNFNHARTATESIKAQLLKIDLEQKRGTLLDRRATLDAIESLLRIIRDRMLARHDVIAATLAGRTDQAEIRVLLENEDRRLLNDMIVEFQKIAGNGRPGSDVQ